MLLASVQGGPGASLKGNQKIASRLCVNCQSSVPALLARFVCRDCGLSFQEHGSVCSKAAARPGALPPQRPAAPAVPIDTRQFAAAGAAPIPINPAIMASASPSPPLQSPTILRKVVSGGSSASSDTASTTNEETHSQRAQRRPPPPRPDSGSIPSPPLSLSGSSLHDGDTLSPLLSQRRVSLPASAKEPTPPASRRASALVSASLAEVEQFRQSPLSSSNPYAPPPTPTAAGAVSQPAAVPVQAAPKRAARASMTQPGFMPRRPMAATTAPAAPKATELHGLAPVQQQPTHTAPLPVQMQPVQTTLGGRTVPVRSSWDPSSPPLQNPLQQASMTSPTQQWHPSPPPPVPASFGQQPLRPVPMATSQQTLPQQTLPQQAPPQQAPLQNVRPQQQNPQHSSSQFIPPQYAPIQSPLRPQQAPQQPLQQTTRVPTQPQGLSEQQTPAPAQVRRPPVKIIGLPPLASTRQNSPHPSQTQKQPFAAPVAQPSAPPQAAPRGFVPQAHPPQSSFAQSIPQQSGAKPSARAFTEHYMNPQVPPQQNFPAQPTGYEPPTAGGYTGAAPQQHVPHGQTWPYPPPTQGPGLTQQPRPPLYQTNSAGPYTAPSAAPPPVGGVRPQMPQSSSASKLANLKHKKWVKSAGRMAAGIGAHALINAALGDDGGGGDDMGMGGDDNTFDDTTGGDDSFAADDTTQDYDPGFTEDDVALDSPADDSQDAGGQYYLPDDNADDYADSSYGQPTAQDYSTPDLSTQAYTPTISTQDDSTDYSAANESFTYTDPSTGAYGGADLSTSAYGGTDPLGSTYDVWAGTDSGTAPSTTEYDAGLDPSSIDYNASNTAYSSATVGDYDTSGGSYPAYDPSSAASDPILGASNGIDLSDGYYGPASGSFVVGDPMLDAATQNANQAIANSQQYVGDEMDMTGGSYSPDAQTATTSIADAGTATAQASMQDDNAAMADSTALTESETMTADEASWSSLQSAASMPIQ